MRQVRQAVKVRAIKANLGLRTIRSGSHNYWASTTTGLAQLLAVTCPQEGVPFFPRLDQF